jgi:hypothetical protein
MESSEQHILNSFEFMFMKSVEVLSIVEKNAKLGKQRGTEALLLA